MDYSKLCAYLPGLSLTSMTWAFDMEDLIILPCIQVSQAVCSTVHVTETQTLRMPVAVQIRTTQAFASGSRRLLMADLPDDDSIMRDLHTYESEYELADTLALHDLLMAPGWNLTAAPCSTLALAYQAGEKLGIMDTHELHK